MKNKGILKFFAGLAIGIGIGFATNSIGMELESELGLLSELHLVKVK